MPYLGKPIPGATGYYVLVNGMSYSRNPAQWDEAEAEASELADLMPVFDVEIVASTK